MIVAEVRLFVDHVAKWTLECIQHVLAIDHAHDPTLSDPTLCSGGRGRLEKYPTTFMAEIPNR